MAIDIATVREYLKARGISEFDALSDSLVFDKEQTQKLWDALESSESFPWEKCAGAGLDLATLFRDLLLKAYGHQANDWHYHERLREREGVFKEMKANPNPETR
jgi:hypothetical protein